MRLPNVGARPYAAGMKNQTDPGDGPPSPDPPSPGGKPPGGQLTPHDSIFRQIFGVPENAASQLRAVLPPGLAVRLDLSRLAQVPASFVDEALKWRYSDLLFTVPLEGRDAFVYVLVEHQSSNDALMAFRMLRYVTRIWDRYLRDRPRARQLPAVIPLVVHHGSGRWSGRAQLLDLIDLDPVAREAMQAYLPRFEYLLDDLAATDGGQLRDRELTPSALIALLLLKTAPGNPRIPTELRPWADQLRAVLDQPGGGEAFLALLTYIELVSEASASELRDLVSSLGPDAEEAYMTTAEMLRAEGQAKSVLRILKNRGIPVDAHSHNRIITCTDVETLDTWLDRSLTVSKVTDLFAN